MTVSNLSVLCPLNYPFITLLHCIAKKVHPLLFSVNFFETPCYIMVGHPFHPVHINTCHLSPNNTQSHTPV